MESSTLDNWLLSYGGAAFVGSALGIIFKWGQDSVLHKNAAKNADKLLIFSPQAFSLDSQLTQCFLELQVFKNLGQEDFISAGDRADEILFMEKQARDGKIQMDDMLITVAKSNKFKCIDHLKHFAAAIKAAFAPSKIEKRNKIRDKLVKIIREITRILDTHISTLCLINQRRIVSRQSTKQ